MGQFFAWPRGGQPRPSEAAGPPLAVAVAADLALKADRIALMAVQFPGVRIQMTETPLQIPLPLGSIRVIKASTTPSNQLSATLAAAPRQGAVVVVLDQADLAMGRALLSAGAADVLYEPVTEAALGLALERILTAVAPPREAAGNVAAFIKAGGGVGATALAIHAACRLSNSSRSVALADLDVQFGQASFYLDMLDGLTVASCLGAGEALADMSLVDRLPAHACGVRLLAAPVEVAPLELLDAAHAEALVWALRRDADLTIVDLPSDWTAWTDCILRQADSIVLVTRLTASGVQLAKKQLRMLERQELGSTPLTIVCNAVTAAQQRSLSIKTAERALGRAFDVVVPDEPRAMTAMVNQGLQTAPAEGAGRFHKAVAALAARLRPDAVQART